MPRRSGTKNGTSAAATPRRLTRSRVTKEDTVPEVYRDMVAEIARSSPMRSDGEGRTVKRRRVGRRGKTAPETVIEQDPGSSAEPPDTSIAEANFDHLFESSEDEKQQQTIYDEFMESDEDEDEDFEDVDLTATTVKDYSGPKEDISVSLGPAKTEKVTTTPRRKVVTKEERKLRLDVHKAHVLCLLAHVKLRSDWCNDTSVQTTLKRLLSRKTISLLHVDEDEPQFRRDHSWTEGIKQCCAIWKENFQITAPGLRRAWWKGEAEKSADSINYDEESLVDKEDFMQAARTHAGSRDMGAQLFCALLRSVAVDARLVCSLQPLPFSGVAKGMTPEKPKPTYIYASEIQRLPPLPATASQAPDYSNPRRRLGYQLPTAPPPPPRAPPVKKKKIVDSPFPIFWVEAFNESIQKWITLDPLVRDTINKPKTAFEPPASDRLNNMSYVVAFEEDGTARDVTLRYARHYNAKTRKTRVESTKDGEKWWKKTMSSFEKPLSEDRDEIEDAELAAKEASEEMPRNVQDFKDHPRLALGRHLRRNEAIWPLHEVGKVSPGMGKDAKLESIYRRSDVHTVRSVDQWYRKGRDIKSGEQPLKRVTPKRKRTQVPENLDDVEDEDLQDGTRLYAEFQTDVYVPPPVVNGRVPKNGYGNIDIYVPSMIPPDAIHVRHPDAARAAKTLGIHYADAVTGFEFKGRQGTAVIQGIVIAAEFRDAIVEVLRSFNDERAKAVEQVQIMEALNLWKKFLVGLRVKERIKEYEVKEPESLEQESENESEREEADDSDDGDYEDAGGGFVADEEEGDGGFMPNSVEETGGGFEVEYSTDDPVPPTNLTKTLDTKPQSTNNHWRTADIDLDAGIFITESPHTIVPELEPDPKVEVEVKAPPIPDETPSIKDAPTVSGDDGDTGGGGFFAEEEEEEAGGGFMTEDLENNGHPVHLTTKAEHVDLPVNTVSSDQNPPIHPSSHVQDTTPSNTETTIPSHGKAAENSHTDDIEPVKKDKRKEKEKEEASDDASEIEKGSLLSEDPEDRDMEIDDEWLE